MSERELYCDACEGVRSFETPPCADGHGPDCPELVCTGCGAAMLVATFAVRLPSLTRRRHRRRPPQRPAA